MKDLLPAKPVGLKVLEPWWKIQIGYITEDDIRVGYEYLTEGTACHQKCGSLLTLTTLYTLSECMILTFSWWIFQMCSPSEHQTIDKIIDSGATGTGSLDLKVVQGGVQSQSIQLISTDSARSSFLISLFILLFILADL